MNTPKDILVTTTTSIEGITVRQYLKPVSAHIVAGTNLFSDFLASFSDLFGGRSQTYQKQLSSIYDEAIERLRIAAYEIGGNCIVGLKIDMDEISGKGKSMFMITAIGTAIIIDDPVSRKHTTTSNEKFENVGVERIKILQRKKEIISKAIAGTLELEESVWDFITTNQVSEVYDFILKRLRHLFTVADSTNLILNDYYKRTIIFLDALPEDKKSSLLYESILQEDNEQLAINLCEIVKELNLLDYKYAEQILNKEEFRKSKLALRILVSDKPFYNKKDVGAINSLIPIIKTKFHEQGIRSMKKQLLSSKEKEIWTCDCKTTNDIGSVCGNCEKDIYGFKPTEIKPLKVITFLEEKISLINELAE